MNAKAPQKRWPADQAALPFRTVPDAARRCPLTDDWVTLKQQVKEANDIVAVVGGYIALRPAGPTYKGVCPFHEDHRPSFDVDPRRQRYRCWACAKHGDVINFVQEFERVTFPEALELLARRAGISLESLKKSPQTGNRARMLDVLRWAAEQFQKCLLDDPLAEAARVYLGERKLTGETVRRFGLGFAPPQGEWLVARAMQDDWPADVLEQVGLIAKQNEGRGYYSRFRDRVMFPIRDLGGRPVGFGGRILPSSPKVDGAPKYYNSAETPLFSKSDQLYGIDQARQAASKAGCLAIVEGYTDVLMAHQHGVTHVCATMGTALNARHVQKLRGVTDRVILVFDADAGGEGGVDRALEVFVKHNLELRIATLPQGLDPCDLLVQQGPEPFRQALAEAVDVFEFKLNQVWAKTQGQGLEAERRGVEELLGILATSPDQGGVKVELMVNRIAHRLQIKEETVWGRLKQLRAGKEETPRGPVRVTAPAAPTTEEEQRQQGPAPRHEQELLELLLAFPALVEPARAALKIEDMQHPGLRRLLEGLYDLLAAGLPADLDHLHGRLDNERLLDKARDLQDRGLLQAKPQEALPAVLARFKEHQGQNRRRALKHQVSAADDHEQALALLRQLHKISE